jgi:hypothetical protein
MVSMGGYFDWKYQETLYIGVECLILLCRDLAFELRNKKRHFNTPKNDKLHILVTLILSKHAHQISKSNWSMTYFKSQTNTILQYLLQPQHYVFYNITNMFSMLIPNAQIYWHTNHANELFSWLTIELKNS